MNKYAKRDPEKEAAKPKPNRRQRRGSWALLPRKLKDGLKADEIRSRIETQDAIKAANARATIVADEVHKVYPHPFRPDVVQEVDENNHVTQRPREEGE